MRRLAERPSFRRQEGAFVIEGPTLTAEALDAGLPLESVFVADDHPPTLEPLIDRLAAAGVPIFPVQPGALAKAVDAVTPQPVAAVAPIPEARPADLDSADVVLLLVGVSDPGNAGTLIRTAEAAGAAGVVITADSVDPFGPKCVRASAGSIFRVPIVVTGDAGEALETWRHYGRRSLATAAGAGRSYDAADYTPPLAVVVGSEAHGIPADIAAAVDEWVHIPMSGQIESLNVALAGALVLFEAARHRRHSTGRQSSDTAGLAPS